MINFRGFTLLMVLGVAIGLPAPVIAQKETLLSQAEKYRERTLVVIIPTQRKKILAMEKSLRTGNSSRRTQQLLEQTRYEQALWQKEVMRGVQEHFTFSKAVFLMDSVLRRDLSILPVFDFNLKSSMLARKDAWFMVRGNLASGAEALILQDEEQRPLERPFPYYRKLNSISTLFESFFTSKKPRWKRLDLLIEKMNTRLLKIIPSE